MIGTDLWPVCLEAPDAKDKGVSFLLRYPAGSRRVYSSDEIVTDFRDTITRCYLH